ncbi:hypothetical protein PoB_000274900 [Plakobranchus ocellatus]|uniref:Uncharacterized protein n=1 Tax=Plakobranchus ocellatus TaxID=259542 RepID=A0AAV3XZW8_9GAST|nr:hypothetical protein PoB_000274900 [Plakobranchus ocellatus]
MDLGEELLEALKNEDLPQVDRLIDLKQQGANYHTPRADLDKASAEARAGSLEMRHLRSQLERKSQADGLRFMEENLSQPISLFKLSFAAVSAQLGGVAGREERG